VLRSWSLTLRHRCSNLAFTCVRSFLLQHHNASSTSVIRMISQRVLQAHLHLLQGNSVIQSRPFQHPQAHDRPRGGQQLDLEWQHAQNAEAQMDSDVNPNIDSMTMLGYGAYPSIEMFGTLEPRLILMSYYEDSLLSDCSAK
jgi:hypothetical protein